MQWALEATGVTRNDGENFGFEVEERDSSTIGVVEAVSPSSIDVAVLRDP